MPAVAELQVGALPFCKTLPTTNVSGTHRLLWQV
jgi:hypothetical protein